jgi:hypothetical protein
MKKLVKNIFYSLIVILGVHTMTFAQSNANKAEDLGKIAITTYIPAQSEDLSDGFINMFSNKLDQITSANGISSSSSNSRFIITANINVISKDLVASAPPMTALTLDVTLYIGDGIDGKKFASQSLTLKGVGTNETKAYIEAVKTIKQNDPTIQSFVSKAKNKIIDYYNSRCDQVIKESQNLVNQNRYDDAIYLLATVPEECTECYNKAMAVILPVYKKKIDKDCKLKLAQANSIWNSNPNSDGANQAGEILMSIDSQSSCIKEAQDLSRKIGKRILELENREWKYKIDTEINLEKDRIKAIRDIGVAVGNGQPKTVTYNVGGWW